MAESSSPKRTSEHLEELMTGYVLNALSPEETTEFEDYLHENPQISQQLGELQELMGLMAYAPPRMTAPPHLLDKILEATKASAPPPRVVNWTRIPWRRIAAIAVAISVLVLGIDNYLLRRKLAFIEATVDTLQDLETRGFALKGTKEVSSASGSVVLDLENSRAVIALQKLPPLPQGESYYLWAFTKKKRIFCGQFNTTASGQLIQEVPIPIKEYDSPVLFMQISRESSLIPPSATQKAPVMTSES
jgi:anti-sigma-K factor RskA